MTIDLYLVILTEILRTEKKKQTERKTEQAFH